MNMLDIFSGDAFSVRTLSKAVNIVPVQYGRLNEMGIFNEKGVSTSVVMVEFDNNVVNLIPSSQRGTTPPKSKTGKRTAKPFTIPRIALDDLILPQDIQNTRQFGLDTLQTVESVVNDRLVKLVRKHDLTNEFLKCGAIAGKILDANGDTILDLFQEFNVVEVSKEFDFTDEDANIPGLCDEITGLIEDNLTGDTMQYVHAMCSPEFFAGLTSHPKVQAAYQFYMSQQQALLGSAGLSGNPLRDSMRKGFPYKGILFEEYRGTSTFLNEDGTTTARKFIEAECARFFPVGTKETFDHFNAPADWMETVNSQGLPRYAKIVPEPGGRHVELLSQSNPLPICVRPKVLVKGTGVYT